MQIPAAVIRDTAEAVFRDPAYNRSSLLGRFFAWLLNLLEWFFSRFRIGSAPEPLFWIVVSVLGALLLIVMARWIYLIYQVREHGGTRAGADDTGSRSADAWQLARSLAARGDYTAAAHALYAGLIRAFERRGEVELHDSKTIGDYLRDLSARSSAQLARFREFARSYEHVIYGVGSCDRETYEKLLGLAQPMVEAAGRTRARAG